MEDRGGGGGGMNCLYHREETPREIGVLALIQVPRYHQPPSATFLATTRLTEMGHGPSGTQTRKHHHLEPSTHSLPLSLWPMFIPPGLPPTTDSLPLITHSLTPSVSPPPPSHLHLSRSSFTFTNCSLIISRPNQSFTLQEPRRYSSMVGQSLMLMWDSGNGAIVTVL